MPEIIYYFVILSFFGWLLESIYTSFLSKKLINRGMLYTPFCPIYGFVGVVMIFIDKVFNPHIILVFILTAILASVVEYIVSIFGEKVLRVHWWNYSDRQFNFQGRICLRNAVLFGLLGATLFLCVPIIDYIYTFDINLVYYVLFAIIILDALANIKNIVLMKKDIVLELGNRSFEYHIFKHHKPVSIFTLFKTRRDKIHTDIKKILKLDL